MTPSDVKYSFDLAKIATHPQHPLWQDTGLKSTKRQREHVVFKFARSPGYQQFDFYRFNVAVVPQHVFKSYSETDIATGNLGDTSKIVGTGPYRYQSGFGAASTTVVWKKRGDWWATKALGLKRGAEVRRRHQERHERRRAVEPARREHRPLQQLRAEVGDQREVQDLLRPVRRTTSARTRRGCSRTRRRKPLNDRQFRRALAFSINMNQILDKAYQGLVNKASPTGLLPIWDKWIDKSVVKKYGFSYNAAKAKVILAAAGYKDTERRRIRREQGRLEDRPPDRLPERLVGLDDLRSRSSPTARRQSASRSRRRIPEYGTLVDDRGHANYDLLLGNDRQYQNTPWTYYQYIYQLPILDNQTTINYERLLGPERLEPHEAAGQDTVDEHQGLPGSDDEAAEDVPAESARNSALVQRHVVDGQHVVLDELAVQSTGSSTRPPPGGTTCR